MSKKSIKSFNEQLETEIIEQIPQLFLCCFCSQMVDYQSFIFHYANCKDVFNQEEVFDLAIKEDIRRLDQMCSSIYHSIESEQNCLIDILELNKRAKVIYSKLVSITSICPKCGSKVSFVNQQSHYGKCGYDTTSTQETSESSITSANSSSISLIQANLDPQKRKRVKGVSSKLKEFACEEVKAFTSFSLYPSLVN